MRKLCFGGSFNPIHAGHLICARAVAEAEGFDRIVLIPSGQPPHKSAVMDMAAASDRLAMCQRAVGGDDFFEVSEIEVTRGGSSFTIDTARELRRRGWDKVVWLIGADMALFLPRWHQPVALLAEVEFRLMERPGFPMDWSLVEEPFRQLQRNIVPAPRIDISSTDIRRRIGAGQSIEYLTPPAVIQYIDERGLYRAK